MCDRVAIIARGRLVAAGPVDEVLAARPHGRGSCGSRRAAGRAVAGAAARPGSTRAGARRPRCGSTLPATTPARGSPRCSPAPGSTCRELRPEEVDLETVFLELTGDDSRTARTTGDRALRRRGPARRGRAGSVQGLVLVAACSASCSSARARVRQHVDPTRRLHDSTRRSRPDELVDDGTAKPAGSWRRRPSRSRCSRSCVGASLVGAEWRAGTMRVLLTWEPRRLRVMLAQGCGRGGRRRGDRRSRCTRPARRRTLAERGAARNRRRGRRRLLATARARDPAPVVAGGALVALVGFAIASLGPEHHGGAGGDVRLPHRGRERARRLPRRAGTAGSSLDNLVVLLPGNADDADATSRLGRARPRCSASPTWPA